LTQTTLEKGNTPRAPRRRFQRRGQGEVKVTMFCPVFIPVSPRGNANSCAGRISAVMLRLGKEEGKRERPGGGRGGHSQASRTSDKPRRTRGYIHNNVERVPNH